MTVSAAFLVKDPPLDRFVALVELLRPVVNEFIVVVDDRTAVEAADIMSSWRGVTLVPFRWVDDFSAARNAALPHCQGDWVLHLDPDEIPTPGMLEFVAMVDRSAEEDVRWAGDIYAAARGYLFFTRNFFDGRQGDEYEEHWHCRLFRHDEATHWYKPVHEQVALDGQPENQTRGTDLLRKAPRAAGIIHSRMNNEVIDLQYAAIGERGKAHA